VSRFHPSFTNFLSVKPQQGLLDLDLGEGAFGLLKLAQRGKQKLVFDDFGVLGRLVESYPIAKKTWRIDQLQHTIE